MSETRNRKGRHSNKTSPKENLPNEIEIEEKKLEEKIASYKRKLRVMSHLVVITSLMVVVLYSTHNNTAQPFAKKSENISEGKEQIVSCSKEYLAEVNEFKGCVPSKCKRVVSDRVVEHEEVETLLDLVQSGLQLGGSNGGASILDLHSGALSHGSHFINIYQKNEVKELLSHQHFNAFKTVKQKIKLAVAQHFKVEAYKIYLTHPTFFSELTARDPVTVHDEYWHPHVDKETYKSFHFTTLLYLNDYGDDFEGGKFIFVDPLVNRTIEPKKGRVSMFTSGKENVHYVERVTKGKRYAVTISFTCDKNYAINDPDVKKFN